MKKHIYVPTSKQVIPEQDFARFLDIDGIGMEAAHELLVAAKVAKFANQTRPEGWSFVDWLNLCKSELGQSVIE